MRSFRPLPLISAMALAFCGVAHGQSLLELYDSARGFDANYQSVQAQFEATRLKSAQAQAKLGPTGSLSVNVSKNNFSYDPVKTSATNPSFTRFYGTNTATVVGSQPLYRPGDKAEVAQSSLQMQVVQEQLVAAEQDLMVRVSQVKALQAAVESSQVALEANKLGYTVGVRINMNVLDAQSKLFDTKAKLAKARYDVLMGHLRLRQVSGTLQLQDLQGINNLLEP